VVNRWRFREHPGDMKERLFIPLRVRGKLRCSSLWGIGSRPLPQERACGAAPSQAQTSVKLKADNENEDDVKV